MIQLSNRFVRKIRANKSNGLILLELSMPTYAPREHEGYTHTHLGVQEWGVPIPTT
jgi:hypothetical protein